MPTESADLPQKAAIDAQGVKYIVAVRNFKRNGSGKSHRQPALAGLGRMTLPFVCGLLLTALAGCTGLRRFTNTAT